MLILTRREVLRGVAAGTLTAALAGVAGACSIVAPTSRPPDTNGGAAAATTTAAQSQALTPRAGGTLRFGTIGDFATLEGQTPLPTTVDHLWSVWDRLTHYDKNMQPQPMLAESWDASADGAQIKFNLRKGVQFHTGRELTSEDIRFSLQRLQDPKVGGGVLSAPAKVIVGFDTPDRYTIVLKSSGPWPDAFDLFEYANIVDSATLQAEGLSRPTGTGPFVFSEYVQGDHLRLVKNNNYWRSDRPYLDEVLVSIRRDAQAAVTQLEAGTLDLLGFGLPMSAAGRLQNDPSYQVVFNTNTGSFWTFVANCTVAPTNNKFVRQALSHAFDRKRVSDIAWRAQARPLALPWSATSAPYDEAKSQSVDFDLDRAKSLLTASGMSSLSLELAWPTSIDDFGTVAQIYQADLAKIGVNAVLRPMEPAAFVPTLLNRSYQGLALIMFSGAQLHPSALLRTLYNPRMNSSGFEDSGYTKLVDQLLATTDASKLSQLYIELNDYLLDQSWAIPVTQSPQKVAARANVHGLQYDAHDALVLPDVWLS